MSAKILIVDDEAAMRMGLKHVLKKEGYTIDLAGDGEAALKRMSTVAYDAVVTDLRMPKKDGFAVLEHAKALDPSPLVIMITAYGDVPTAVKAMQEGAFDFITKPFKNADVRSRVKTALIKRGMIQEEVSEAEPEATAKAASEGPRPAIFDDFPHIITKCPQMAKVLGTVKKVARTDCSVLVLGESGTGKELIARSLHRLSKRHEGPMLATASLTESVVESELFGHKKGSFTGAVMDKSGFFEAASGGTLFLDEVADLSPKIQQKLLRVIQEREIVRVGETKTRKVDVRLVAATWKNLREEIMAKRFREDLYFRLNVITIQLPPLRDRKGDIPMLVRAFLKSECEKLGMPVPKISPEGLARVEEHDWPGNIRELKNCCIRLGIYGGDMIDEEAVEFALEGQ